MGSVEPVGYLLLQNKSDQYLPLDCHPQVEEFQDSLAQENDGQIHEGERQEILVAICLADHEVMDSLASLLFGSAQHSSLPCLDLLLNLLADYHLSM